MSRYRGILEKVDVFLAQSRLAQATNNTLETIEKLMGENQDYLRGYYEGSRGSVEEKFIWRDKDTGEYKVAENLLAFQLYSQEVKKNINANRTNKDWMRALFGSPAQSFNLIEYKEEKEEDILQDFFKDKIGILLTEQLKEQYTKELIELGLRNKKGEKDFTFDYVAKRCRELNVCDFKSKQASKKDVKNNSDLTYKKYYLQILEK